MKNELVKHQPMDFKQIEEVAKVIAEGNLFPLWNTKEKVMTLMLLAKSDGIDEMQAVNRYDLIGGRIAKRSQAKLSDLLAAGGKVKWIESTIEVAKAEFTLPNGKDKHIEEYSMEDARRAQLVKPNGSYYKNPKLMLRARCVSAAATAFFPHIGSLMPTTEELDGVDPIKDLPEKNVTPKAEKPTETPTEIITPKAEAKVVEAEVVKDEKKTQEQVTEKVAEVEKEKPAEDDINKGTVQEFIATLPKKKVDGFLREVRWPKVADLTETNLKAIDEARPSFKKNVEKWVKGQV